MTVAEVTREVLVRHLETWAPAALSAPRGATFVQAYDTPADRRAAEAALRVFADLADRRRGRRLSLVLVAPDASALVSGLDPELRGLGALAVDGGASLVPAALAAARGAGAHTLACVDTARLGADLVAAVATGRPAELITITRDQPWPDLRAVLLDAGFPLTAGVDLVADHGSATLGFATTLGKSLEAFKNALWAADEYAGVRYRDPTDPDGHLLDISLSPHPGPLRRELLGHLATAGDRTVTELRRFTLTDTVYRAADTAAALGWLLTAGQVTRSPETGRLSGDVVISLGRVGPAR